MSVTIKTLTDWRGKMSLRMQDALGVSIDVMGRNGEEACRHALILMAQSAAKLTPKAKARREVSSNQNFKHLLRKEENGSTYKEARQAGRDMSRYFKFEATRYRQNREPISIYGNKKSDINRVPKSRIGLAKRSWMWGLGQLGATEGRPINGAVRMFTYHSGNGKQVGYGKVNMLSYITKILPASWQNDVERLATNKIMAQAALKIKREFVRAVESGDSSRVADIAPYFKAVA